MKLTELLDGVTESEVDLDINGLELDSRKVQVGDAFIALRGATRHGIDHVAQAIANGAKAVIYDPAGLDAEICPDFSVVKVAVPDLSRHLGAIAARFYGYPSGKLAVVGITGTNGKTTCSQLIAQSIPECGVIGTLGWGEPERLLPTTNTTPDALAIHRMLQQFVEQHKSAVAMEVSSHGLHQGRVNAVDFKGAVFTNLSRDHLDYHSDMGEYLQAKLALFTNPSLQFAVINLDDPSGLVVLKKLASNVQSWTFSTKARVVAGSECIVAENIRHSVEGIYFVASWRDRKMNAFTPIVGSFNLENVLAVLAVLLAFNVPFRDAVARLAQLKAIAGRMEKFGGEQKPTVFVDYAHSPDALEKVLKAAKGNSRLWVVFGCGGNRDKGKRAEMGRIAETLADEVVITDDNPRCESSKEIIKDILAGCQSRKVTVINDRTKAIKTAIQQAAKEDCVMIAGKGHENYQEIDGIKLPFSDQDVVKQSLAVWGQA